jgi:plasmid stabilization system protein ParE
VSDRPTLRFLEEAEADFHEGLRYYVERDRAVAQRFDRLIKRTTGLVVENPGRWPIKNGSHRYVLRRFPYTVAYIFHDDIVSIIAVAHHRRDPASWENRR